MINARAQQFVGRNAFVQRSQIHAIWAREARFTGCSPRGQR